MRCGDRVTTVGSVTTLILMHSYNLCVCGGGELVTLLATFKQQYSIVTYRHMLYIA